MANNIEFDTNKKFLDYDGLKTYHAKLMEYIADSQSGLAPNQKYVVNADTEGNRILIADPEQNGGDFDRDNGSYIDITYGGLTIASNTSDDVQYPYGRIDFQNNDDNETTLSVGIVNCDNNPHISIDSNVLELSNGDNTLSIIGNDDEDDETGIRISTGDDETYAYIKLGEESISMAASREDRVYSALRLYHDGAYLSEVRGISNVTSKLATEKYVKDLFAGGIRFAGVVSELPDEFAGGGYWDEEAGEYPEGPYRHGDLIIVAPNSDITNDPAKEYILIKEYSDEEPNLAKYHWELLGETTAINQRITNEITRATEAEAVLTNSVNNKADKTYVDDNFALISSIPRDYVRNSSGGDGIISIENSGNEWDDINGTINISTSYGYDGYTTGLVQSSNIELEGSQIKLTVNDELENGAVDNTFKLNENGLTYNDSPIVTPANADELNILKTDEDGVVNKSELSIGSFVIKDDKPFNYTLSGSIQNDYYSISFVAEYNKESAKYVEQGWYDYYYEQEGVYQGYVYTFVITEATSSDEYELPGESYIGQKISVPAYMIDSDYGDYYEETRTGDFYVTHLDFSESNSHVITLPYCELQNYESETYWPLTCTITESAPFALKKASKATLNGKPIVTNDILANTESNIIKDINKKLENFVSASKSATSSISLDESGESYNTIKSITSFSNGGTYIKMGYTHDVLYVEGSDVQEQQISSITNNKDGIIMSNERRGLNTDLWSGFVDADKSQVKVSDDSISFIVEDYEVTYNDIGEPDSYIVRPKTVKLDKTSFTYNNKQIATVDQLVTPLTPSQLNELTNLFE